MNAIGQTAGNPADILTAMLLPAAAPTATPALPVFLDLINLMMGLPEVSGARSAMPVEALDPAGSNPTPAPKGQALSKDIRVASGARTAQPKQIADALMRAMFGSLPQATPQPMPAPPNPVGLPPAPALSQPAVDDLPEAAPQPQRILIPVPDLVNPASPPATTLTGLAFAMNLTLINPPQDAGRPVSPESRAVAQSVPQVLAPVAEQPSLPPVPTAVAAAMVVSPFPAAAAPVSPSQPEPIPASHDAAPRAILAKPFDGAPKLDTRPVASPPRPGPQPQSNREPAPEAAPEAKPDSKVKAQLVPLDTNERQSEAAPAEAAPPEVAPVAAVPREAPVAQAQALLQPEPVVTLQSQQRLQPQQPGQPQQTLQPQHTGQPQQQEVTDAKPATTKTKATTAELPGNRSASKAAPINDITARDLNDTMVSAITATAKTAPDPSGDFGRPIEMRPLVSQPATVDASRPLETPYHAATDAMRTAEPIQPAAPVRSGTSVQEMAVRISQPDTPNVDVHVTERAGQIQVAVRTADPATQSTLREDLGTLVNSLQRVGYRAETFTTQSPALRAASSDTAQEDRDHRGSHSGNSGGGAGSSSDRQQQRQRDQRSQAWFEELEKQV